MPFTPFHFGPGLFGKSLAPQWFSMATFASVQVVIDVETLYHIVQGHAVLHRELHTFVGATITGLAVAALILAATGVMRRLEAGRRLVSWMGRSGLDGEIRPAGIVLGGLVGGATHPLFDGLMHRDIRPFRPFADANPLLGLVDVGDLHVACLAAGVLGAAVIAIRLLVMKRQQARSDSAGAD